MLTKKLYLRKNLAQLRPAITNSLIRIGNRFDGGYVLPQEIIKKIDALVSLGLSIDWSFDEELKKISPNIVIHGYDHTISEKFFINNAFNGILRLIALRNGPRKCYQKFKLLTAYRNFFQGDNIHFEQRVNNVCELSYDVTVDQIFSRLPGKSIFLKIDIEGSEYLIIKDLLKYKDQIIGLAIEFHNTNERRSDFTGLVDMLLKYFDLVHLHANNCGSIASDSLPDALELTFARKGEVTLEGYRNTLPISNLDYPNDPKQVDYELCFSED